MRKTMYLLLASLLFLTLPALAQHGHASGGHGSYGGSSHGFSGSHAAAHGGSAPAKGGYTEHHDVANGPHAGYHYSGGGAARNYYRGGRYDHEYFNAHWGAGNRFYWGHCNWWGPRFGVGSYFWFGGGYWTIVDPIPYDWYDDEVYVDYVDGYGYVLINPTFPGVYYHVGVRF
jgi:hypothetical protein